MTAVSELIQKYGIDGEGGAIGGVRALEFSAENRHVEIVELVADQCRSGRSRLTALIAAAAQGLETPVKFLQQHHERRASGQGPASLNKRDQF